METRKSKLAARSVTPAEGGSTRLWIPAFAGMTPFGGLRVSNFDFRLLECRSILTPDS
jgi:hypothetical protein